MPTCRITAALFISLSAATLPVSHAAAQSSPPAVLVELFTSEGCSSCPPADALLRQINGTQSASGQSIVGISEHVTYWNSLGSSDPFSSTLYTDRQSAYGARFHLDGVYTPQMVLNGAHQFLGSDRPALLQALRAEQSQASDVAIQIASATPAGSSLTVRFPVSGDLSSAARADLFAVLADDMDQSNVLRGENSGKTLSHVAVARSLTRMSPVTTGAEQTATIPVPPSFHGPQKRHLILFAQTIGSGRVLAVDQRLLAE